MNNVKIKLSESSADTHKLIIDNGNMIILFDYMQKNSESISLFFQGSEVVTFFKEDYEKILEVFDF